MQTHQLYWFEVTNKLFYNYYFIFIQRNINVSFIFAAPCSMCDLSSPARNQTYTPGIGSTED